MTFAEIAVAFLKAVTAELDGFTSEKGVIVADNENQSVTLFTPGHIQFAAYGRGPGKQPPMEEILEWVKTSGKVQFDSEKEAEGTAWAIAKSIAKNGTKNYVPNAPDLMKEVINDNLKRYYDDVNENIIDLQITEIDKIVKETYPEKIEFKI